MNKTVRESEADQVENLLINIRKNLAVVKDVVEEFVEYVESLDPYDYVGCIQNGSSKYKALQALIEEPEECPDCADVIELIKTSNITSDMCKTCYTQHHEESEEDEQHDTYIYDNAPNKSSYAPKIEEPKEEKKDDRKIKIEYAQQLLREARIASDAEIKGFANACDRFGEYLEGDK